MCVFCFFYFLLLPLKAYSLSSPSKAKLNDKTFPFSFGSFQLLFNLGIASTLFNVSILLSNCEVSFNLLLEAKRQTGGILSFASLMYSFCIHFEISLFNSLSDVWCIPLYAFIQSGYFILDGKKQIIRA